VDWQQFVSLVIVAAAVGGLLWLKFNRRKFSFQRDTSCGCSGGGGPVNKSSIIFHARKGSPPEVRVRMR
jgi:hypothetical protein